VLVNNAGTAIPKTFEEATLEEMDRVIDINIRGVFVATQAALKHMRDGGRIIMIGSSVGRACVGARACALLGHEGGREDIYSGAVQRGREPRHYGQQRAARPHRYRFDPATGDWSVPQKAATALNRYGNVNDIRRDGGIRGRSGCVLYHRVELDGRWRHERLNRSFRKNKLPMKNKVVLITGALTGIGRATALAFAREGAQIAVCGRRDDVWQCLSHGITRARRGG